MNWSDSILRIFGIILLVVCIIGSFSRLAKALWRFGLALWAKKICIVGDSEVKDYVKTDLVDSGLIKKKSIILVDSHHLDKLKDALLIIIQSDYLEEGRLEEIAKNKEGRCGMVVYCPPGAQRINDDTMKALNVSPNCVINNFRGRLLGDVLVMLLCTSFKRSDAKKATIKTQVTDEHLIDMLLDNPFARRLSIGFALILRVIIFSFHDRCPTRRKGEYRKAGIHNGYRRYQSRRTEEAS